MYKWNHAICKKNITIYLFPSKSDSMLMFLTMQNYDEFTVNDSKASKWTSQAWR